jgi:hypothetical protein
MKVWLLVEGGLHRGAVLCLEDGVHTIGSGADDDVLISDDGVQPGHLRLEVGARAALLHVAGDGVRVALRDKLLVPGSTLVLKSSALLREKRKLILGGATLSLRDRAPAHRGASSGEGRRARRLTGYVIAWPAPRVLLGGGVALGMGALVLGVALQSSRTAAPASSAEHLQSQLSQRADWRHLRASRALDGRWVISGAVDDRTALHEALRLPAFADTPHGEPAVRVVVKDELLRHVAQVLQDPGLQLRLEPAADAGSVPLLVVSGSTQRPGVPALLNLLRAEWAQRVEIVDRTAYESEASSKRTFKVELPIRITAVNVAEAYVEAADGRRYFVGSTIAPGQTLDAIHAEHVAFSVGGRRIDFRLP